MLRISEIPTEGHLTLRLEGRLIGPWVSEVHALAERYLSERRHLVFDLTDVAFVGTAGLRLLRELADRDVRLTNCSPFLAEQLR